MSEEAVVIPASAGPAGDAEYVARMVARADGVPYVAPVAAPPVVVPPVVETPALLAGKFKDAAALEAAYVALQAKLGAPKPAAVVPPVKPVAPVAKVPAVAAPAPVVPPVDPTAPALAIEPAAEVDPAIAAAEAAASGAGMDFTELSAEFATNGVLADESYAKLEASGIPRAMVDQFIEGQVAVADRARAEVFTITKGEQGYADLVTWAKASLPAAEIEAYNTIVNGRDMNATKMAVSGLAARMAAAEGIEPNLIGGGEPGTTESYASSAEMQKDMRDPKYKTDAAFRDKVMKKLGNSTF